MQNTTKEKFLMLILTKKQNSKTNAQQEVWRYVGGQTSIHSAVEFLGTSVPGSTLIHQLPF